MMVFALSLLGWPANLSARSTALSTWDCTCKSGDEITLRGKLECGRWPHFDIANKQICFSFGGTMFAQVTTDRNGLAETTWTPPSAGLHLIDVYFGGSGSAKKCRSQICVGASDSSRPAIILDIDGTLCETKRIYFLADFENFPALADAARVVHLLTQRYDALYLTARVHDHREQTLAWLERNGFPRLPTTFLPIAKYPTYDEAGYKLDTLATVAESYQRLEIGIGDRESDAIAYNAQKLRTIILRTKPLEEAHGELADSWSTIESMLLGDNTKKETAIFENLYEDK